MFKQGDNILYFLHYINQNPNSKTRVIIDSMKKARGLDMNRRTHTQYFTKENSPWRRAMGYKNRYVGILWEGGDGRWKLTQAGEKMLASCTGRVNELKLR